MASLNSVVLVGNLTRDVDVRFVGANSTPVAEIGLAVNDRVKKGDQWVDEPCFCDVVVWGRQAEYLAEHARKGAGLIVNGRLKMEEWTDKQTGQKRSKLKVQAERAQLLDSRKSDSDSRPSSYVRKAEQAVGGRAEPTGGGFDDDSIPF